MTEQHNPHDHSHQPDHQDLPVDLILLKRLRFISIAIDYLSAPKMKDKKVVFEAVKRQLAIVGRLNANMPLETTKFSDWVYAGELMEPMLPSLASGIAPEEMAAFLQRCELIADMPLKENEKTWKVERKQLAELDEEKPTLGIVRLVSNIKIMQIVRRQWFESKGIKPHELHASKLLLERDLQQWQQMGIKPHWFNDSFLRTYRVGDDKVQALSKEEKDIWISNEMDMVAELFLIRHDSPDALAIKKTFLERLAKQ